MAPKGLPRVRPTRPPKPPPKEPPPRPVRPNPSPGAVDRFSAYRKLTLEALLDAAGVSEHLAKLAAEKLTPDRMFKVLTKRGSAELLARLGAAPLNIPVGDAGMIVDEFY